MTYLNLNSINETQEDLIISNYFSTINESQFIQAATLFAEDRKLLPPFEKPVVGQKAIASYLAREAKGIQLYPQQEVYNTIEGNTRKIKVIGKVKTPLFTVNVAWFFDLNSNHKISMTRIKLLASPKELLSLKKIAS